MKKIQLIIFLILFCVLHAQNVSFYDSNFKNKILNSNQNNQIAKNLSGAFFAVDSNQDNEISLNEASQVSYLDVSNSNITNTWGITSFTNLVSLHCQGNSLTNDLNLSSLTNLVTIECQNNQISSLYLVSPISINASSNKLTVLNYSGTTDNLSYLNISNNLFGTLTVDYPSLVDLFADGNPITTMNFQSAATTDFILHPITQLENLTFSSAYYPASFTIRNFPNLKTINSYGLTPVNGLILDNLPSLIYASISKPIKITVKNVNPSISSTGLNLDIREFHLQDVTNTDNIVINSVRADKYYFENLTSVNNLSFNIEDDTTDIHFSNSPSLHRVTIGANTFSTDTCIDLDFSTIPSLKNLEVNQIKYSSINLSNLNQLKTILVTAKSCNPNNSIINLSNLAQLEEITIKDIQLKSIVMNSLNSVKDVKLYGNNYSSIVMNTLPQLHDFLLDTNNQSNTHIINTLDFNNLPSLQNIELIKPFISAISFNNLPNLKTFKTRNLYSSFTSSTLNVAYNFSNLPLLEDIILNNSMVSALTFNNLPSLKNLTLKNTYFGQNYTFQDLPVLENLVVEYPQIMGNLTSYYINNVSFNNLPLLKSILLKDFFYLNNLNFGNINTSLENFYLKNSATVYGTLTSLSLDNFPQLKVLEVNHRLTNLQLTNLPQLHTLNVSSNIFTSLNIVNLPSLQNFTSNSNLHTPSGQYNINFTNLPVLKMVNINYNLGSLKKIDLSQAPQLEELHFISNPFGTPQTLDYINLKNGNPNMLIIDTDYVKNICVDDDNERILLQSSNSRLANTIFTSYCTLSPAGSNYIINGNTTYDTNNNGCDPSDPKFPNLKIGINTSGVSSSYTSNQNGTFNIPLPSGSYTITPNIENPTYYNVSPVNLTANFPTQSSPLTQNFCLTANGTHNDLEVFIIPVTAASPGFEAQYKIVYKNKGTTAQSGNIVFNFNDDVMNYATATVAPNSQSTGTINWNLTNLLPFETKEILLTFTLNTPTQTPALHGGDVLHYTAQINGANDETPADNHFVLNQTVVNSFDPNDKTCLEGASISQTQVGEYVHYLIRFENTGTANARNIVVKDEIDTSKFDLLTLVPLNGSHNFITRTTHPNVVEFIFENIQLPFDDAHNDGYISFKIKTKSTLVSGNSFSNTAKIYFDYNAPIITNTYTTNIGSTLGTLENNVNKDIFSIYPNPAKDILFITSKEKGIKAEIYDTAGRILTSASLQKNSVNISELTKGTYFIKLFTKDQSSVKKFIKN